MPVATNYSWYLGSLGSIEADPFSLLGTYGGPGNALANEVTPLETSTNDPTGIINENTVGQTFSYDVGGGAVTQQLEQMNYYNVTYTLVDGTAGTAEMWVVQAVNGDTFALMDAGADNDIMQAVGLRSLEFTSLIAPEYSWQQAYHTEAVAVCFVEGTRLRTPQGWVQVERLGQNAHLMTLDGGVQRLCWAGATGSTTSDTPAIRFSPGLLGNRRSVLVSPQHRILVSHWMAELWFGTTEVLVPARAFLDGSTVTEHARPRKAYYHVMFDRHQVINAEGAAMESLLFQEGSALAIPKTVKQATGLRRLLAGRAYLMRAARPVLSVQEGRSLVAVMRQSSLAGFQMFSSGKRATQRSGRLSRVKASDLSRRHCATFP